VNSVVVLDAEGKFLADAGNSRNTEFTGHAIVDGWEEMPMRAAMC